MKVFRWLAGLKVSALEKATTILVHNSFNISIEDTVPVNDEAEVQEDLGQNRVGSGKDDGGIMARVNQDA